MDALDIARWQFGIVTVYHFLFVPLTIGLSFLIALMQTVWYRTGNPKYLQMTKFWGKLFLINFAMGVVTGIVQEFQFGMNWSDYSRFVGDVFGAPLAIEALVAFFLEATFIGLWIFGWDRLPKLAAPGLHLAGGDRHQPVGVLHPGRQLLDAAPGRLPRSTRSGAGPSSPSLWEVLNNSTNQVAFPHVVTAAFVTAAAFVIGISAWHLRRAQARGGDARVAEDGHGRRPDLRRRRGRSPATSRPRS